MWYLFSSYSYFIGNVNVNGKFVAFDLDWTLVRPLKGRFSTSPEDVTFMANRLNVLKWLFIEGYTIVIMTNQLDCKSNPKEKSQAKLNNVIQMLKKINIEVIAIMSHKKDYYRKPEIGMYNLLQEIVCNIEYITYVGDAAGRQEDFADSDLCFAQNCNIPFLTPEDFFPPVRPDISSNKTMIIMVGSPGSGKTSYVKKYLTSDCTVGSFIHVESDAYKSVFSKIYKVAETVMMQNNNVVIDATNPTRERRQEYYDLASRYNYKIIVINMESNGYEWNKLRTDKKVNNAAFGLYFKRYEAPDFDGIGTVYYIDRV